MGGLGGPLGGLGDLFGGLGGLLGRLGGILGGRNPAWVHFCRFKLNRAGEPRPAGSKKRPHMAPKMRPKTDQNRRQKLRRKKTLFKIVLKRSWRHLGSFWQPPWSHRIRFRLGETAFREKRRFCKSKVSRGDLVPNLGQLGTTWGPLRATWGPWEPTWANFDPTWAQLGSNLKPSWPEDPQLGAEYPKAKEARRGKARASASERRSVWHARQPINSCLTIAPGYQNM